MESTSKHLNGSWHKKSSEMSDKFLIAIISKDERFSTPAESHSRFVESHDGSVVERITNNKENITVLGNRLMERCVSEGFDFLIMMHSDVEVDLNGLSDHICECKEKYDVMGLCGCEKISVSQSPLNWFCGSRPFPEFRWGCVCHGELGDSVTYFSRSRPEIRDHAVSCIDGLCMIFSSNAIKKGLRFDENLRFNCYDTQISLDAVMNFKLRVGCLVERELKHFSVGKSILTDDFLKDELVLRKRFGFGIPPGSKLEKLLDNQK